MPISPQLAVTKPVKSSSVSTCSSVSKPVLELAPPTLSPSSKQSAIVDAEPALLLDSSKALSPSSKQSAIVDVEPVLLLDSSKALSPQKTTLADASLQVATQSCDPLHSMPCLPLPIQALSQQSLLADGGAVALKPVDADNITLAMVFNELVALRSQNSTLHDIVASLHVSM